MCNTRLGLILHVHRAAGHASPNAALSQCQPTCNSQSYAVLVLYTWRASDMHRTITLRVVWAWDTVPMEESRGEGVRGWE